MNFKILILFFILFTINNFINSSILLSNNSISPFDYINKGICPQPLLYRNSTDFEEDTKNGYHFIVYNGTTVNCIQPCPSLYFIEKEWNQMMDMALVVGTVSFFASCFLLLTYSPLLNKSYKNRHTVGILSMFFGIFLIMLTDVWNLKARFQVGCPETGRYSRQWDAQCGITGIIFQFGCVSAVIWWSVLAFDLYFSIKKIITKTFDKYYIVIINLFSLILTFVPVIGKQYGYTEFALGCWILDFPYQISCFWIPLSICLISSTVVVLMILYEVYKIIKASNHKTSLKGHIKPLLCLICNCLEFFYMFGYSLFLKMQMTSLEEGMDNYIQCLMENIASPPGSYSCKPKELGMTAQFLFLLSLRLLGVSGIIFFGFNNKVKKIWLDSFLFNNKFMQKYFSLSSSSGTPGENNNNNKRYSVQYSGSNGASSPGNSKNYNINFSSEETPQEPDFYYKGEENEMELSQVNNNNNEDLNNNTNNNDINNIDNNQV